MGEIGYVVVDIYSDVFCGCGRCGCVEWFVFGFGIKEEVLRCLNNYLIFIFVEVEIELIGKMVFYVVE